MTRGPARRGLRVAVAAAIAAGVLAVVRPWTVVPSQSATARSFDPQAYVTSSWESRVLPAANDAAIDLEIFMRNRAAPAGTGQQTPRAVFVRGTAVVAEVDRTSRIGLARLRLPWAAGPQAAIQVGPVLRGTALRDALDFIRFTDFVNQIEFASVANALNERVISDVLAAVNLEELAGRQVAFIGAVPTAGAGTTLEIVPVRLQVTGSAR